MSASWEHVTVRKDDPLNVLGPDQAIEILFRMDRDTGRIQGAGQRRGIDPVVNVGNLRGSEPHDPIGQDCRETAR
jgi:hypothetical protein